jgi:hypothetical protein
MVNSDNIVSTGIAVIYIQFLYAAPSILTTLLQDPVTNQAAINVYVTNITTVATFVNNLIVEPYKLGSLLCD